jgi:hypothetical protein
MTGTRTLRAGLVLALVACSASNVERRHLADGSWEISCRLPMDECVRQADQLCMGQRYRILRGLSQHVVRGAGPSQVEFRTSELAFACSVDESAASAAPVGSAPRPDDSSRAAATSRVCTPGATQACVGAGGCAGGQACVPDGSAYGPCDCGPARETSDPDGARPSRVQVDGGA